MRITLVVPTLNELEGLKKFMPQIHKEWVDQTIILIGLPQLDTSEEWARKQGYEVFIGHENLWVAYTKLFKSGMVKGNIVITFAPDGNSIPSSIPELIKKMEQGYDMVIASRYLDYAFSEDDTLLTGFGNHLLTRLCNLRSHYKYTDALNMYRAFRYDVLEPMGFLQKPDWLQRQLIKTSNLYSYEPSMAIRLGRRHWKVAEIPSSEPKAIRARRQNTFVHGFTILMQIIHENCR